MVCLGFLVTATITVTVLHLQDLAAFGDWFVVLQMCSGNDEDFCPQ